MVAAVLLMVAAVACFLPKKSEGAIDVEKTARALRHEANSRARKVTAENPKTEDEWAIYHYYGISSEEIRKGQVKR